MPSKGVKKRNIYNNREILLNNISLSISEYIDEKVEDRNNTVAVGKAFSEWVLSNVFELRDDEIEEATEIAGSYDNGLDGVFEVNNVLYLTQFKYSNAHCLDAVIRFKYDSERLLTKEPITDRQVVRQKCSNLRDAFNSRKKIICCYITNKEFTEHEITQIKEISDIAVNVELNFWDINCIYDKIDEKTSRLPKQFRGKIIPLMIGKNFEIDDTTIVTCVSIRDFAKFVKLGGNLLFHSNIRNYLTQSKINMKIQQTLQEHADKFWYYNNGVTIVCEEYLQTNNVVSITEPQIVNGCQTAKTILDHFSEKNHDNINDKNINGKLLIKIIRTKKSESEEEKKKLRDNITRYTNSQNAVRGLDFYALDEFQRGLQKKFENYGYYYEIQRGAYVGLDRASKSKFKGIKEYEYLVAKTFKNVLPAKEVIQAYTAGIKQLPSLAYGKSDELTPLGSKWDEICNERTKSLPIEHFLFPLLVLKYAKNSLGYKSGANDFRKSTSLLFVTTYYMAICEIVSKINDKIYEMPEEVSIDLYKVIFKDKNINREIMNLTHKVLDGFFEDSKIEEDYVSDNINVFLKTFDKTKNEPWYILVKRLKRNINNEEKLIQNIKVLFEKQE